MVKIGVLLLIIFKTVNSVGDLPTIWKIYHENGTRFTVEFQLFCPFLENRSTYYFGTDLCEFDNHKISNFMGRTEGTVIVGGAISGIVHGHQMSDQFVFGNGWELMINIHHNCTFDGRMTCMNVMCPDDCYYTSEECYCNLSIGLVPHSDQNSCHVDLDSPCDW